MLTKRLKAEFVVVLVLCAVFVWTRWFWAPDAGDGGRRSPANAAAAAAAVASEDALALQMRSPDPATRQAVSQELLKRGARVAGELTAIVQEMAGDNSKKPIVADTIRLLGALRAPEAVPILVANLVPKGAVVVGAPPVSQPEIQYPIVGALIQIGLPSLGPLVERVKTTDDQNTATLGSYVIKKMLGPKVGLAYVEERLAEEQDPAAKQRLTALGERVSGKRHWAR